MKWDRERIHEIMNSGIENGAGTAKTTTTYEHPWRQGKTVEHSVSAVNPRSLNSAQLEAIRKSNLYLKQGLAADAELVLRQAKIDSETVSKASLMTQTTGNRAVEKLEHHVTSRGNLLNISSHAMVASPDGGKSSAYYSPNGEGKIKEVEIMRRADIHATDVITPSPWQNGFWGRIKHAFTQPQIEEKHLTGLRRQFANSEAAEELDERDARRDYAALVEAAEAAQNSSNNEDPLLGPNPTYGGISYI